MADQLKTTDYFVDYRAAFSEANMLRELANRSRRKLATDYLAAITAYRRARGACGNQLKNVAKLSMFDRLEYLKRICFINANIVDCYRALSLQEQYIDDYADAIITRYQGITEFAENLQHCNDGAAVVSSKQVQHLQDELIKLRKLALYSDSSNPEVIYDADFKYLVQASVKKPIADFITSMQNAATDPARAIRVIANIEQQLDDVAKRAYQTRASILANCTFADPQHKNILSSKYQLEIINEVLTKQESIADDICDFYEDMHATLTTEQKSLCLQATYNLYAKTKQMLDLVEYRQTVMDQANHCKHYLDIINSMATISAKLVQMRQDHQENIIMLQKLGDVLLKNNELYLKTQRQLEYYYYQVSIEQQIFQQQLAQPGSSQHPILLRDDSKKLQCRIIRILGYAFDFSRKFAASDRRSVDENTEVLAAYDALIDAVICRPLTQLPKDYAGYLSKAVIKAVMDYCVKKPGFAELASYTHDFSRRYYTRPDSVDSWDLLQNYVRGILTLKGNLTLAEFSKIFLVIAQRLANSPKNLAVQKLFVTFGECLPRPKMPKNISTAAVAAASDGAVAAPDAGVAATGSSAAASVATRSTDVARKVIDLTKDDSSAASTGGSVQMDLVTAEATTIKLDCFTKASCSAGSAAEVSMSQRRLECARAQAKCIKLQSFLAAAGGSAAAVAPIACSHAVEHRRDVAVAYAGAAGSAHAAGDVNKRSSISALADEDPKTGKRFRK